MSTRLPCPDCHRRIHRYPNGRWYPHHAARGQPCQAGYRPPTVGPDVVLRYVSKPVRTVHLPEPKEASR